MKQLLSLGLILFLFSCNKKTVQLPEIDQSSINEISDVSPAYLFYNEEKDSVELNRKNLISTTNWLVNIDKRISLKQAIPQIKFLQEKKANSSHKKEGTKNYFTCNDTSKKDLGFIDFSQIEYHTEPNREFFMKQPPIKFFNKIDVNVISSNEIQIIPHFSTTPKTINISDLVSELNKIKSGKFFVLNFSEKLNFQDYITVKSKLLDPSLKNLILLRHEFIFN